MYKYFPSGALYGNSFEICMGLLFSIFEEQNQSIEEQKQNQSSGFAYFSSFLITYFCIFSYKIRLQFFHSLTTAHEHKKINLDTQRKKQRNNNNQNHLLKHTLTILVKTHKIQNMLQYKLI